MVGLSAEESTPDLEALGGWRHILTRLTRHEDLTVEEARAAMAEVLTGNATDARMAAFVIGLRMKGESVTELSGMVASMLDHAVPVQAPAGIIDTCGTGGDGSHSINVSTIAAFVVAGTGQLVCKHGGRAASSAAGSADVMEALGVSLDVGPEGVVHCLQHAGIAFLFAPRYHPALRHAAPVRAELGVRTTFNFLAPLANPARPKRQMVGVSDRTMAAKLVGVLAAGGTERALVVYGHDGLDELTTTTTSTVVEMRAGEEVRSYDVDPSGLGLPAARVEDLKGADPATNAGFARAVLEGKPGAHRDIVLLNAAAALVAADAAPDLAGGLKAASQSIDSGQALSALERLVVASGEAAGSAG